MTKVEARRALREQGELKNIPKMFGRSEFSCTPLFLMPSVAQTSAKAPPMCTACKARQHGAAVRIEDSINTRW